MRHNLLITLVFLVIGGCNDRPVAPTGPTAGSETHWLAPCDTDAACGEDAACVCGLCTAPCAADDACAREGGQGRCATAASPAADAACEVLPAGAPGICVAACVEDADCVEGLDCVAGACVAPARRLTQEIAPAGPHAVDFLFVIDDSGSMCGEQAGLADAMADVVPAIAQLDARIAVTTTDVLSPARQGRFIADPTPPVQALGCAEVEGPPDTADCAAFLGGRALPTIIGARDAPDVTGLKGWFKCLALVGTEGDGFEGGLWALHRALACDGPNAAHFGACCRDGQYDAAACAAGDPPDFLRPGADLVVVFVSDEDDCSAPAQFPGATAVPGCRDVGGDECAISRSQNANCEWDRDRLEPVSTFRDQLVAVKGDPGAIAVWAFVGGELRDGQGRAVRFDAGEPAPMCDVADPAFDPDLPIDACCTDGQCAGEPRVSCEGAGGEAFAGHRYLELARSFPLGCAPGDARLDCGLCADTLPLVGAVDTLPGLQYGVCLDAAPTCAVLAGDALRPCATADEAADPANRSLRVEVACDGPGCVEPQAARTLAPDEYRLTPTPLCASGLFLHPAPGVVPAGGRLSLRGVR
ncbi:MAG: hypothetical protein H6706_29115 [Myxococcales bacterium]|nr:hypothetical protein [Myxococcales bacterium]